MKYSIFPLFANTDHTFVCLICDLKTVEVASFLRRLAPVFNLS